MKPYACNICGKTFKHISHRNRHQNTNHTGKTLTLEMEDRSFDASFFYCFLVQCALFVHCFFILISFSGEERPYNCELCKKGFLGKTHLVTHFRRYHHDLGAHQIDTLLSFMLKTERYKPS